MTTETERQMLALYGRRRRRAIKEGTWEVRSVPAGPTLDHIAKLRKAGMGCKQIADATGLNRGTICGYAYEAEKFKNRKVRAETEALILAIKRVPPKLEPRQSKSLVEGIGVRRRLEALTWLGWDKATLAPMLGITPAGVKMMTRRKLVHVNTLARVTELYNNLWQTPGPSDSARYAAQQFNMAPPLAWDDETIDDPAAKPNYAGEESRRKVDIPATTSAAQSNVSAINDAIAGRPFKKLTRDDRRVAVRLLNAEGLIDREIAARLHVDAETIFRDRKYLGLEPATAQRATQSAKAA